MIYNAQMRELKAMYKEHCYSGGNGSIQVWWDYIAKQPKELVSEIVDHMFKIEERLKDFKNGYYFKNKVRKYCNERGWSDVHPYEVVEVISNKTVKVRAMDTKQTKFPSECHIGGFAAHYADNRSGQDYEYISNPDNPIKTIRLGKKGWAQGRFYMSDKPYKFYDYNF